MERGRPLKIGITCYPTVGGSGILASELGEELAKRGHEGPPTFPCGMMMMMMRHCL